jgi:glycosyltransferase involved in cell wall biosynthesis
MQILKSQILNLPNNITVDLKKQLSNKEVLNFFKTYPIDLFVSFSISEGIPVSMMESISFGVPIAAYPICGIPEIVIPNITGQLFESNSNNEHEVIDQLLDNPLNRTKIITFQKENFSDKINYTNFIECISNK